MGMVSCRAWAGATERSVVDLWGSARVDEEPQRRSQADSINRPNRSNVSRRAALQLAAGAGPRPRRSPRTSRDSTATRSGSIFHDAELLAAVRLDWPVPPIVARAQWGANESLRSREPDLQLGREEAHRAPHRHTERHHRLPRAPAWHLHERVEQRLHRHRVQLADRSQRTDLRRAVREGLSRRRAAHGESSPQS